METEKELFTKRQLAALLIPLILEQILGITVGMADSVMVSAAGEAAVSGVSLVDSINILLVNTFCSLSTGGAVLAAHRLGEKKFKEAARTADQLLLCVTGIALVIMIFSLLANRMLLHGIFGGVEQEVMENAVVYFYITALSFPFLGIYSAGSALARSMGNSKVTMYISVMMNVVNIAGNAVFLFVFHAGVFGMAASTLISRILGAVVMTKIMLNKNLPLSFSGRFCVKPCGPVIRGILKVGLPTGMDNCIFQIGKILVQSLVAGFGTSAITANAITGVVAGAAVIPASATGVAMITIVGQAIGAGDLEAAKRYVKKLLLAAYAGMILLNGVIIILAGNIAGLYDVSEGTASLAKEIIIFHSVCAVLFWPLGFTLPNALRAAFDAAYTMFVSIGSMWVFRIGFSYLLGVYFHMGLLGVWAAMGIDWFFRSACFLWRMRKDRWLRQVKKG